MLCVLCDRCNILLSRFPEICPKCGKTTTLSLFSVDQTKVPYKENFRYCTIELNVLTPEQLLSVHKIYCTIPTSGRC